MKKQILLLGMALASMGVSAQHIAIDDLKIQAGGTGNLTFTISDVDDWAEYVGVEIRLMLPDGVTFEDNVAKLDFGGVWSESEISKNATIQKTSAGAWAAYITADVVGNSEVTGPVKMSVPVIVADYATPGDYELDITTEEGLNTSLSFEGGERAYYFGDEDEYENATLTITSATAGYLATVYESTGTLYDQPFANAAEVETFVTNHKNAILAFASSVPAEIAAINNVVVAGNAKSIILTNEVGYTYAGEPFTAEKVSFDYYIGTFASKAGGWNSLAIPFTGEPADVKPFTTADMTSGEFWAKEFTHSTAEGLKFGDLAAAQFEANKSYLVAFPGSDYGVNAFASSSITISAENTTVYPAAPKKNAGAPYSMTTIYTGNTPANSYVLNPAGTKFELKTTAETAVPFTAFASAESGAPVLRSLAILDANQGITSAADAAVASTTVYGEDGEIVIIASEAGVASIVNMNGQVVKTVAYNEGETRVAIAAGAYVVAGQVVIVK